MGQLFERVVKSRKGNTSPIILCTTIIIVITAAFLADIGYAAVQHFALYSSVKQAAINGAESLLKSRKAAEATVKSQILKSAGDITQLDTIIADNCRELTVSARKPFEYLFIKFLGIDKKEISSKVTVRLSGVMSFKGVRPFGISSKNFRYGTGYILANKPGTAGNAMKAILLDIGNESLKNTIILGYQGKLKIGDSIKEISPEITGSMTDVLKKSIDSLLDNCKHEPKCTYEKYDNNCSRIIIIPVLDAVNNKNLYKISGFTAFFVEEISISGNSFSIKGKFIKHTVQAGLSDGVKDYGLAGIRVIGS